MPSDVTWLPTALACGRLTRMIDPAVTTLAAGRWARWHPKNAEPTTAGGLGSLRTDTVVSR